MSYQRELDRGGVKKEERQMTKNEQAGFDDALLGREYGHTELHNWGRAADTAAQRYKDGWQAGLLARKARQQKLAAHRASLDLEFVAHEAGYDPFPCNHRILTCLCGASAPACRMLHSRSRKNPAGGRGSFVCGAACAERWQNGE